MMRSARIALITVAAVVLLAVAAVAVLLVTMDDADYRRLATYLVERASGREVIVDGPFVFHPSLRPSLVASQVRIANPPWASGPDLAKIDHLEVQVALRPLLSGTLVIERLILNDATFALERSADGAVNWTMATGDAGRGLVPVFGTVRMRDVAARYRDDASGHETSVQLAHLTLEAASGTGRLDAEGAWDGQPIAAKGTLGTLAEALNPTSPFPVDLTISLPGLDLGVRGTIAEPAQRRGLDLHLAAQSDDVGQLLARLDSKAPLAGPLEGEGTLRGDVDELQFTDLHLTVGKPSTLEVQGAIATVRPGAAPLLDGIALEIEGSSTTTALASWLGRPLPDLGPVAGRLSLSGNSEALKVSEMKLQTGEKDGPTLGVSGDLEQIRLDPTFGLQGADLQLEAAAPDLAMLGTMLDVALPHGAFSYDGRLSGDFDKWTLAGEARLGDTALSQTFTGSIAGTPPRLAGEMTAALAGLELSARGSVADLAKGQGLDLHLVGHADDAAPFLGLLGYGSVPATRLAAEVTIGGDVEAMRLADLSLTLDDGPSSGSQPALQAKGQIAKLTPGGSPLLDGIALDIQSATSTTVLSSWLGRPLPDLGPLQGQFTLTGTSSVVQITDARLQAGSAEGLSIAATGGIDEIRLGREPGFRGADLHLDARAPNGRSIGALLDIAVPRLAALRYTGRLRGDLAAWGLAGKVQVGRTVIDEDLSGSYAGARPRISGKLSIPILHIADFGIGSDSAASGREAPHSPAAVWPSPMTVLDALHAVDLALSVDLDQVEGTSLAIGQGEMDLSLEDGVLRIDPARFDLVAGTALVHATADARAQPPQFALSLHVDDVQLGELLRAMGKDAPITGELALILDLQGRGNSSEQLASSLDGKAQFAIQRGGVTLGSLNLATADVLTWLIAGARRGTGLLRGVTTDGQTKLKCFAGRFAVADGIATAQSLLMTTPLTLSTATGTVDLVDQTIDLEVQLRARRESTFDPATTFRIQGPLASPTVDFSRTGFVARTIAGLVLKPLDVLGGLLLPLVSDGGHDPSNPCLNPTG